jgi:Tfp pilus assembly protein PilF
MTPEIEQLTRLIQEQPLDPWPLADRAWAYLDQWQPQLALRDFDAAIALDDAEPEFWLGRGDAHARLNLVREPREDYSRAIALDPEYAPAYAARGWDHSTNWLHEEADFDLGRAIALEPSEPHYRCLRGFARMKAGEDGRAVGDFDEAIRLDPAAAHYHAYRADALLRSDSGPPEDALPWLDEAIRLAPPSDGIREQRGCIRYYQGRWSEAASDFTVSDLDARHGPSPYLGAESAIWLYLAQLFQGEEASGERAVRDYLVWYRTTIGPGADAGRVAECLGSWPVPLARYLAGEIDAREARGSLVLDHPWCPPERELHERRVGHYHFVMGQQLLARGDRAGAMPHLVEAAGLKAPDLRRRIAMRQIDC